MVKQRVFGLDLMRAIAILLVVFSHISWIIPNAKGLIPDLMSLSGVIGVEIFFVLSGFLIGRIIYKIYIADDFGFSKVFYFWIRRWFRTLPNYYLALVLNIGIVIYLGSQLPKELWRYVFFFQNFANEIPKFFMESWSLSIEEFAYIIGPFLLYTTLFIKTKASKSKLFLITTLGVIFLFIISKIIYSLNDSSKNMIYWNSSLKPVVIYRIDAIYYGVLAAYISIVKPKLWMRFKYLSFILGMFLFLGLNVVIPIKQIFIETHTLFWNVWYLSILSIAIMLSLPVLSQLQSASKMILKPITFISIISYAIYVLHYSIILQLLKYFLPSEELPKFDTIVYIMVYLSLTLVLSYILYKFYEKPFTDLRDSKLLRNKFK
jgi:peptidoglycan/LPS O-acetylase OafA/YrhL